MSSRNRLAMVIASLLFGAVLAPYYYVALGVVSRLTGPLNIVVPVVLGVSTVILLAAFAAETAPESWLRQRLGRLFGVVSAIVAVAAFVATCAIWDLLVHGAIFIEQYWFYVLESLAIGALAALAVVLFTPASRLERVIAARLSGSSSRNAAYRVVAWSLLAALMVFAGVTIYRFYLAQHPVY